MLLLVLCRIDRINRLHLYFVHNSGAGNIDLDVLGLEAEQVRADHADAFVGALQNRQD